MRPTFSGTHAAADKIAVEDYGDAGFGFRAAAEIEKGQVLCLIPLQLVRHLPHSRDHLPASRPPNLCACGCLTRLL